MSYIEGKKKDFDRDLNYYYGSVGRSFKKLEDALTFLTTSGYTQITQNLWRNRNKKAWLTKLRDSVAEPILEYNESKHRLEHLGVRVISYYPIGWLVTIDNGFRPISCKQLKLSKVKEV